MFLWKALNQKRYMPAYSSYLRMTTSFFGENDVETKLGKFNEVSFEVVFVNTL